MELRKLLSTISNRKTWAVIAAMDGASEPISYRDIAKSTGVNATYVHRLLSEMETMGVVTQYTSGTYQMTSRGTTFMEDIRRSFAVYTLPFE